MRQWVATAAQRIVNSVPATRLLRRLDALMENQFSERGMVAQAFALAHLNGLRGDYFEFGLWRGRTFLQAHRMKRLNHFQNMHLWGFDSFQGLPEVKPTENEIWSGGQFACSEPEFRSILARNGVRPEEFTLVPGYYQDSLNDALHARIAGRVAAIVYIDCDLYKSTVPVLAFMEPYLTSGTIVCFDDFYCYCGRPDEGEQRALAEFLQTNPAIEFQRFLTYSPAGQSFIVYRKSG
jgi:O-methyltransferase